ncbi:EI24 domain-containing protein [Demequina sp. NBRC 110055]|uniref:EI24 domain-containing protein n=1 Tax=Demequina sp. NBRC 110055 TaxID=1570344 RepID=UPI000A034A39|nr:EI24 domain-containing protein [Demequina sp. NBRC 110055]
MALVSPVVPIAAAGSAIKEAAIGARMLVRGLATWRTAPRTMAWGLLPAALSAVILGFVVVAALAGAFPLGTWTADLAFEPGSFPHGALRLLVAVAVVGAAALISIYTFTALALLVGQPFFERISRELDAHDPALEGEDPEPWWRAALRGIAEWARLLLLTVPLGLVALLVGLIPVVGTASAFALSAGLGGWLLTLELTSYPLSRRGIVSLAQRRRALRGHRARAVGFGAAVFLVFLIPGGVVAMMPAAAAGGTALVRSLPADRARRA